MDILEKARAYDEALEKAKKELNTCGSQDCDAARQIFRLFPELKESEGEGIRKNIISFLRSKNGYMNPDEDWDFHNRWLPWLEKQDGQKATTVWHDVSEVPDEMQELLVEWESPDATWHNIAFYDAETKAFRHLKQPIKNVTRWAYISDILTQSATLTNRNTKSAVFGYICRRCVPKSAFSGTYNENPPYLHRRGGFHLI